MKYKKICRQTTLYQSFSIKRLRWQEDAVIKIYNKLCQNSRFTNLKVNEPNERLVITCGIPQCGKTELVLQLLGIKPEYLEDVYNTTRAEQPKGCSSTSTVINYHCSDRDKYGYYDPSKQKNEEIIYLEQEELVAKLKDIRIQVEKCQRNQDVLHIYIPKSYFNTDIQNQFSILDLPGVNGSNRYEKDHVKRLFTRYLPMASVIIIVCKSNLVKDFETSGLNETITDLIPSWKKDDKRFMLAITSSYTSSSALAKDNNTLKNNKLIIKAKEMCLLETRRHLNSDSMLIFPLDIGESLRKLNDYYHISKYGEEFVKLVHEECKHTISLIYDEILERENHAPLQVISYWTKQITNMIEESKTKCKELISELDSRLIISNSDKISVICEIKNTKAELKEELEKQEKFADSLKSDQNKIHADTFRILEMLIQEVARGTGMEDPKSNKKIANAHKLTVKKLVYKHFGDIYNLIMDVNEQIMKNLLERGTFESFFKLDHLDEDINEMFKDNFWFNKKATAFLDIFNVYARKKYEIGMNEIKTIISSIIDKKNSSIIKRSVEIEDRINYLRGRQRSCNKVIRDDKKKRSAYTVELRKLEIEKNEAHAILEQQNVFIKEAYENEKKKIKSEINSKSTNVFEKTELLLYLSLAQKEYETLIS